MAIFRASSPLELMFVRVAANLLFPLNFTNEMGVETAPFSYGEIGIDICSDMELSNLEYADDVLLLSDDPSRLHIFIDPLNDSMCLRLGWTKQLRMLFQDWIGSKPNIFLAGEQLGEIGRFGYLDSCLCLT